MVTVRPPVPFGQYVPVDSPIHTLEARAKMILIFVFAIVLFMIERFSGLVLLGALAVIAVALSKVSWRIVVRGLKAVTLLLLFTLLAHSLRWEPATVALIRVGPLAVDPDGLIRGIFFSARIMLLVIGSSLLTLTTSPVELTDGLTRLMRPLERIRVPVGEIAMILTIALRFIPTTAEEAEKIVVAQIARGARFDQRWPLARARAYIPVLIPLFVGLFKRSEELAVAMEARCYHGGHGRTRLNESRLGVRDMIVMVSVGTLLLAVGVTL